MNGQSFKICGEYWRKSNRNLDKRLQNELISTKSIGILTSLLRMNVLQNVYTIFHCCMMCYWTAPRICYHQSAIIALIQTNKIFQIARFSCLLIKKYHRKNFILKMVQIGSVIRTNHLIFLEFFIYSWGECSIVQCQVQSETFSVLTEINRNAFLTLASFIGKYDIF